MKSADEKRVGDRLRHISVHYAYGNVSLEQLAASLADLLYMIELMRQRQAIQGVIQDLKDDV